MKKLKLLILLFAIMLTGCTVVRINTTSIDNIISVVLSKDNKLYNHIAKGYKYYVPRGVTYIDTNELNEKLYSEGTYYYLYIDAISYYYKTKTSYEENSNAYYSKKLKNGDKEGYVEITEQNGKYLMEFVYNYAKIEAVVSKKELNDAVLNASYILSTIKYNRNVVKLMLNDDYFTNKEEKYDIFDNTEKKETKDNFLKYEKDKDEETDEVEVKEKNEVN